MTEPIRFIPRTTLDAQANLAVFVDFVQTRFTPLQTRNRFEEHAWSVDGLIALGNHTKFVYFTQLGVKASNHYGGKHIKGHPAKVPEELLLREPFCSFAKAFLIYLHCWETTVAVSSRVSTLRYLEAALQELNGSTCPTATSPEVLNRACALAVETVGESTAYAAGKQLKIFYRYMVELGLVAMSSDWECPLRPPQLARNRIGKQFDEERQKKLPSPLALEALAAIFNSDSNDPTEVFSTSVCALMLCDPGRSVEVLFSPLDILASDWIDPDTGEVGTVLRWYPAKGAAPTVKIVIPSMRDIAIRAVDRLRRLGAPARALAQWYEQHPDRIYLPPHLEYLSGRERLDQNEIHAVLFGGPVGKLNRDQRTRVRNWLDAMVVPRISKVGGQGYTTAAFSDLEQAVLAKLPLGFPVMNPKTGMRYSEALCLALEGEFDSHTTYPSQCCFDRIKYNLLKNALNSNGTAKSIFERRGYRDESGAFLYLKTHMLRHYLNTLVRQSGRLTEEEIAKWSGRKNVMQNATYNHQSDRDVIAKLRSALGDPTKSVGPFAKIDNRIFIRRDEFASIKVITAHTTEFGYCVHDYAQSPCQVHQDCMHCNEQVCIKGDARAEENLRKTRVELARLQEEARAAFSSEVLGSAEWFAYQTKTLERVNQLIAILDDPAVPQGAVIQLSGVVPPSRLSMAEETRNLRIKPVSNTINSLDDVHALLADVHHQEEKTNDAG